MKLNEKNTKLHYKMYKSGKKWLISGITTAVMVISISDFASHNQASANDQVGVQENQNNTNNSINTTTSASSNTQSSSVDSSKATTSTSSNTQSSSVDSSKATTSTSSNAQSSSVDSSKATTSISSNAQSSSVDSSKATTSTSSNADSSSSDSSKAATSSQSADSSSSSDSESDTAKISSRMLNSSNDAIKALPSGGSYVTTDGGKTYKYVYQNSPIKGLYNDNGKLVYFDGYDGTQARGVVYNIDNSNYIFDKNSGNGTKIDEISGGQYRQSTANDGQNAQVGSWVYQKTDNNLAKGIQSIDGNIRYFNSDNGSQLKGGTVEIAGADYYFESGQGDLISNVDQIVNNGKYVNSNGNNHYVDSNNILVKGLTSINNSLQYFDNDGNQVKNQQVTTNGATYYFDSNGNGQYLFTNTGNSVLTDTYQHNAANSTNINDYKNTVDGFLTADSWYRPKDILDGGTTWRTSSSSDYRPIITTWWPNKDIQVNYLKLMQDNGLLSKDVQYNRFSDQTTLDQAAQTAQIGIEQKIKQENSTDWLNSLLFNGNGTTPSFVKQQFIWSASSEYPWQGGDQWFHGGYLKYVNNPLTPTTNSNYRNKDNLLDFLLANDIDNSNPSVQAEDLNWLYYMMNFGSITTNEKNSNSNFDGIRIDAENMISTDIVRRTFDYLRDAYSLNSNEFNANSHLSIIEGGLISDPSAVDNSALITSPFGSVGGEIQKSLTNSPGNNSSLENLIKEYENGILISDHSDNSNFGIPNYSYVHAHDIGIQDYISEALRDSTGADWSNFTPEQFKTAIETYYNDQKSVDKKYNFYNIPSAYALLLTNRNTVPRVYYGDLYQDDGQYMQNKSIYYNDIVSLMLVRKKYVSGGQSMTLDSSGLLKSVRFGKGAMTSNDTGTQETRNEGIGLIVGNDPSVNLKDNNTITLNMGAAHKNQQYRALMLTTNDGIQTYDSDDNAPVVETDSNGNLNFSNQDINNQANTGIHVVLNPQVSGYLSVWVPVGASENQDARTSPSNSSNTDGKILHSNDALDSNLIYEGFSSFQPNPTSHDETTNVLIANNSELFKNWGITDFEMAPQYKSSNDKTFVDAAINNGYAFSDRYDLGFVNPTKYGTDEDLRQAISSLHQSGMQVMADIVYNQIYSLPGNEVSAAVRVNGFGDDVHLPSATQLYVTNTIGGGEYQKQYGGEFLNKLKEEYPDLFKAKDYDYYQSDGSIGKRTMPDIFNNEKIKQWSAKYMNGTNVLGRGIGYVLKDWNTGNYFKLDNVNSVLPNNLIYRNGWTENNDGSWSYYDTNSGKRLTGIQEINGQRLYFNDDGIQVKGQIANVNGQQMYFDPNSGELIVNDKLTLNGVNYDADANGVLSVQNDSSNSDNSNSASKAASASASTAASIAASKSASEAAAKGSTSSNNSSSASFSTSSSKNSSSASSSSSASNSTVNTGTTTNTGNTVISTGFYVAPTTTTSSASSSATSSVASSASSSAISSASSSSATISSSSVEDGSNAISTVDSNKAKVAMIKAQNAVKVAEKLKNQTHSKAHVKNYNKALNNYYQAEKQYLKVAKLYNSKYYYDFDNVNKHSKYVKLSKKTFVYDSKQFTKANQIHKLKKGTKVKVNKIVRHGKITRFNIGHNKFITGLKSFININNK